MVVEDTVEVDVDQLADEITLSVTWTLLQSLDLVVIANNINLKKVEKTQRILGKNNKS